jgi:hypothetical protein
MRLRPRSALAFIVLAPALVGCEHVTSIAAGASTDGGYSTGWTSMDAGAVANINAISGAGENAIVIVGDNGLAAVWDGTTLRRESTGTSVNLRGVWALDASHAFAVGDNGTILERKGTTWTRLDTTAALTAGLDAGAGDAGGAEAGATASALPVLTAVWADAQRVVAVGEKGVVLYRDAADFVRVPNKEVQNLLGVTGTAGGEIDAVGGLGVVFDVTATALTRRQIAGFTKDLAGATTTAAGSYFVGLEGS